MLENSKMLSSSPRTVSLSPAFEMISKSFSFESELPKTEKRELSKVFLRCEKARKMLNFQNYTEMAAKLGVTSQVFTDIKKGKHGISKRLAEKIAALDDRITVAWLLTGDGDTVINGSGNVTGDNNNVNTDAVIAKAIEAITTQQSITAKSQEQIDKLLLIIEKLT